VQDVVAERVLAQRGRVGTEVLVEKSMDENRNRTVGCRVRGESCRTPSNSAYRRIES